MVFCIRSPKKHCPCWKQRGFDPDPDPKASRAICCIPVVLHVVWVGLSKRSWVFLDGVFRWPGCSRAQELIKLFSKPDIRPCFPPWTTAKCLLGLLLKTQERGGKSVKRKKTPRGTSARQYVLLPVAVDAFPWNRDELAPSGLSTSAFPAENPMPIGR